jgi:hypothetical protein
MTSTHLPFFLPSNIFFGCHENQGIGLFYISIGLWVVYRHEGDLRPNWIAKIHEHATIKALSIINYNLLWNSIVTDDVLPEEFLDRCGGYVSDGLRLNPLGEIFN